MSKEDDLKKQRQAMLDWAEQERKDIESGKKKIPERKETRMSDDMVKRYAAKKKKEAAEKAAAEGLKKMEGVKRRTAPGSGVTPKISRVEALKTHDIIEVQTPEGRVVAKKIGAAAKEAAEEAGPIRKALRKIFKGSKGAVDVGQFIEAASEEGKRISATPEWKEYVKKRRGRFVEN